MISNGCVNILLGIDETRKFAHSFHINLLNGTIRSIVGSYKSQKMLDIWDTYEKRGIYSDYEISAEAEDKTREFASNETPIVSLVEHDVTIEDELTWLSALRMLVTTKSLIQLDGENISLSSIKDSNSSLSLVMTYLKDDKFFSKRLSGVDCAGKDLNISDFVFLTPQDCRQPFTDIMRGVPETVTSGDCDIIYNKVSLPAIKHFRKLPSAATNLHVVSKLVMLRDVLSMVTSLLAVQLFEPTPYSRSDPSTSDYESRGYVKLQSKKYKDTNKTAKMFFEEFEHQMTHNFEPSRLDDELVYTTFKVIYASSVKDQKTSYFQFKKLQSLLSIILMECKLNMFYNQDLSQHVACKLDYHLILDIGGRP